jgi:hypothetical protein
MNSDTKFLYKSFFNFSHKSKTKDGKEIFTIPISQPDRILKLLKNKKFIPKEVWDILKNNPKKMQVSVIMAIVTIRASKPVFFKTFREIKDIAFYLCKPLKELQKVAKDAKKSLFAVNKVRKFVGMKSIKDKNLDKVWKLIPWRKACEKVKKEEEKIIIEILNLQEPVKSKKDIKNITKDIKFYINEYKKVNKILP